MGVEHPGTVDLATVADRYRAAAGRDVEIVARDGTVLVAPRSEVGEFAAPAVRTKLAEVEATSGGGVRTASAGDEELVIAPIGSTDRPVGAVIVRGSDETADKRIHGAVTALIAMAAVMLGAVALLGAVVARSVTRPLTEIEKVAMTVGRWRPDRAGPGRARPAGGSGAQPLVQLDGGAVGGARRARSGRSSPMRHTSSGVR